MPQPLSRALSHFETFGVEPRFAQDLDALESRFYGLSRALHPDRFSQESPEVRQASLDRMGLINEAYRVLRDRAQIREALIAQAGLKVEGQGARSEIPMEIAEAWFELQDQVMESLETAAPALSAFAADLRARKETAAKALRALEDAYDAAPVEQRLERLQDVARQARSGAYLDSLERDLRRLHLQVGSHGA